MKKLLFTIPLFLLLYYHVQGQSKKYRYNYRHEIFFKGRFEKQYFDFFSSIGYEYSINKKRLYASITNEMIVPLSMYTNFGNSYMSMLKANYQNQYVTSLGVGFKRNFRSEQTNFVAIGEYKHDIFKHKWVFVANVLFELTTPKSVPPLATGLVCTGVCPKHYYLWYFGVGVGKYF
jgi:hypothetical protein